MLRLVDILIFFMNLLWGSNSRINWIEILNFKYFFLDFYLSVCIFRFCIYVLSHLFLCNGKDHLWIISLKRSILLDPPLNSKNLSSMIQNILKELDLILLWNMMEEVSPLNMLILHKVIFISKRWLQLWKESNRWNSKQE